MNQPLLTFTGAFNTSGLARIVVTGGGGMALIFGEVDATGSISDVFVLDGGRDIIILM